MNTQILSDIIYRSKGSENDFFQTDFQKSEINFLTSKKLLFLAGCLLGLSMPGYNLFVLAFCGFIPVLLSIFLSSNYKNSAVNAYIFGLGYNLIALNWLLSIHPLYWLGLNGFQSVFLALFVWISIGTACSVPFLLWGLVTKYLINLKVADIFKILLISISWVILNNKLLSSLGDLSFPWAMIEYSQYNNLYFLQLASVFKGISLGFYIMVFNSAFTLIIFKTIAGKFSLKKSISYTLLMLLSISIFHILGFMFYKYNKISEMPQLTLVQTNISMENANLSYFSLNNLKKYYIKRINQSKKGIIIFPEGAIPDFINKNDINFIAELNKIAKKQDKTIILGYLNNYKNRITNSAMIIDGILQNKHYDKIYLVPFGETVPLESFLPSDIRYFLSKSLPIRFKKGLKSEIIKTKYGNIGTSICYEIIFPELMQKQNNADLFINISNLGWFRSSRLKEQFIAFAKMRAVENRMPVAASINTGFSFVVNSDGRVIAINKD